MSRQSGKRGKLTLNAEVTNVSSHGFWLHIAGKERFLPFEQFPWFRDATISQLTKVKLISPRHLHWPDLDIDLSVDSPGPPRGLSAAESVDRVSDRPRGHVAGPIKYAVSRVAFRPESRSDFKLATERAGSVPAASARTLRASSRHASLAEILLSVTPRNVASDARSLRVPGRSFVVIGRLPDNYETATRHLSASTIGRSASRRSCSCSRAGATHASAWPSCGCTSPRHSVTSHMSSQTIRSG